jgi:Cytochrome c7 and related cytochrome c
MARTRTTKAVAQRIDLNYFKRSTPFKRAKLWLAVVAPMVALVWIGWHFLAGDARAYSSGRLSPAHAVLEKECAACHARPVGGFSASAADSACLACHDGPAHHPGTASGAPELACAECHTEHRGRVKLAAASTRNCAACHADLSAAAIDSQFAKNIRSFADGHPDFAALRPLDGGLPRDSGTIKLNHALHMTAIRRGPNGPIIRLNCGDCHRPSLTTDEHWEYGDKNYADATVSYTAAESFEPGGSRGLPAKQPWSDRQLMAPVKFANACVGCHSLAFDKRFEEGVPHDRPMVIHAFLIKKFREYILGHPNELNQMRAPLRSLAGKQSVLTTRRVSADDWITEQVSTSEELLWHKTCSQCHELSAPALQDVNQARWEAADLPVLFRKAVTVSSAEFYRLRVPLPNIAAGRTKLQWLPHARFDHDAHTGFSCAGCHQKALTSAESSDILIPGIAVCQTCHASGPANARDRCSECHTYHDWSKRKEVKPTFTLPALRGGT